MKLNHDRACSEFKCKLHLPPREIQKRNRNAARLILSQRLNMSLPELKVVTLELETSVVLTLVGHLNALTVESLESALREVLATSVRRIVFDCSELTFTSSAGLRVFLATVKRMKSRGGTCAFTSLTPAVRDIFEMAGFLETMEVYGSRQDVLDFRVL